MPSKVVQLRRNSVRPEDQELAADLPINSLLLLLRSARYAQNARRAKWDFAVSAHQLRASGLSDCDLRWLAYKGYVEYAMETSRPSRERRMIEKGHAIRFTNNSSFILTPQGVLLATSLLATD